MTSARGSFCQKPNCRSSFKAKRPMSRLETVESEEERWAEDRLLSSRGGGGGWGGVGVVYTGRWAGPPSPRYRVRPGSSSVLGRPPAREGLFLALCDNFQEDTYHQQLVAELAWHCDAVTDEREFSWCCQSSRRWAQILTKEVKKSLLLPSSSQLSKLRQSLWSLQKNVFNLFSSYKKD